MIMERAPGYTLEKFIHQKYHNELSILNAVQLTQKLLKIVKNIHSKRVFYGNIKPEHIMIEWDFKNSSIEQAELTLINFSQAYTISDKIDSTSFHSKPLWYEPLSANAKKFQCSSTMDASGICAVFFWLLTKSNPNHDYGKLPHQQDDVRDQILSKIYREVSHASKSYLILMKKIILIFFNVLKEKSIDGEALKIHLIHTFDIGFDYRDYQPWTINSLEVHLEIIREILVPSDLGLSVTEDIFEKLSSVHRMLTPVFSMEACIHQGIFEKASKAFYEAKKAFVKSNKNQYSWSNGTCIWLNNEQSISNERRNNDILSYYSYNQGILRSYSMIITCFVTVSDEGNIVTLSVGSSVNDVMIRIPIDQYSKAQNYIEEFSRKFNKQLTNLLISIYKQQKVIEQ